MVWFSQIKSFQEQATMISEDQITRSQKLLSSSGFRKGITSTPDKSQTKWIADCKNHENVIKWDFAFLLHVRN